MGQQVSKGMMCLHMRKLSFLGIAVAGVYCCMGLRSVSIKPRSCLLLRSEPSIVSFNWQGSLVIRLVAIVSINGLSRKHRMKKKRSCPQFFSLHYCLLVMPQSDMNFCFFLFFFEIWKVADLNLTDPHPKLRTVIHTCCMCCKSFDNFHITSKHYYVMSKPFFFKIPACPDTQHIHCLLAQPQSVKFLKATCERSMKTTSFHTYVRTYIRLISAWLHFQFVCLGSARGHHKKI